MDLSSEHRIILVHDNKLYISWTGEIYSGDIRRKLFEIFLQEESAYITGVNLFTLIAELNKELQNVIPGWIAKFTNRRRLAYTKDDRIPIIGGHFFADYVLIRNRLQSGSRQNRKHKHTTKRFDIINLELYKAPPPDHPIEQMEMALAILDMCDRRGVKFRSTRGSLSAAMIKASPKWEKGRRSAFPFINKEARKHAPGNHYARSHKVKRERLKGEDHPLNLIMDHVFLVDQNSAHHNVASQIKLVHPEDVRARGNWKQALEGKYIPWCHPYSHIGQSIMREELIGLFLIQLRTTHIGPSVKHLQLPYAQERGCRYVWVYTPDLRIIANSFQLSIESICCGMAGVKQDEAIKEYADWSLNEIARDPKTATYKKSVLLSGYGMLSFNPFNKALLKYWGGTSNHPNKVEIPRGGIVTEHRIKLPENVEPSIVNVVNRGLIESETRARSIEYARELHMLGYHVAQIYADALLIETDSLPFIKEGWRISHSLEDVWIPRDNAFLSSTICKLPGFKRGDVDSQIWRERYEDAIRPIEAMK